ncbi:hypothetical protein LY85_2586 [Clostridium sp. KNHs216]|nr:hypothetical protein LY85_2586 [Clostridium sp. KNHs216]
MIMDTKYINMRKLNNAQIFALRKKVVKSKLSGRSNGEISRIVNVNPRQIQRIWCAYLCAGECIENLRPKPCGRKKESGKLLSPDEEQSILKTLMESTPEQHQIDSKLWTRKTVSLLIKMKYDKLVPQRSVTNYLKQWRLSYSKSHIGENYIAGEFSLLQQRAKVKHAKVYWVSVHDISQPEQYAMTNENGSNVWCIKFIPRQKATNAFFAIPSKGATRFLVVHNSSLQSKQINFLSRLMQDASDSKVIAILDNDVHLDEGKRMQGFLCNNKDKLEIISLAENKD